MTMMVVIVRKDNTPLYTQLCSQYSALLSCRSTLLPLPEPASFCSSCLKSMAKKTVVSVQLLCTKCKKKVMKLVADLDGVTSIVLDPSKGTATVVGEADPALIIKKIRKFKKCAELVSVGPPKDEEKYICSTMPNCCQRCDAWFIQLEDNHRHCPIL